MSQNKQDPKATKIPQRPRRLVALRWVLIVDIFMVVACIALDLTGDLWNRQTANMIIFGAISIAVVAPMTWFFFAGRRRLWIRLLPPVLLVLLFGGAAACFDGTDGNLIPKFRFPWLPDPDEELVAALPSEGEIIQVDVEADDNSFWQFLGPGRDARVDGVDLVRDWNSSPPKLLWRQQIGAGYSGFAAAGGYAFTMEQRGPLELTTCYDLKAGGPPKWVHEVEARYEHGLGGVGPRCTPALHEGKVYALGATGILRCLDITSGKEIWFRDLLDEFDVPAGSDGQAMPWGRTSSPLIAGDLVIVPAGGKAGGPFVSLVAYDKNSGEEIWRGGNEQISCASPNIAVLCGQRQIITVNEGSVSGHRFDDGKSDGEVLWKYDWHGANVTAPSCSQAVVLAGNHVFVSKHYGGGSVLFQVSRGEDGDYAEPKEIWRSRRTMRTKFTNVAVQDDHIFGLSDGLLECIEYKTGKSQWIQRQDYGHGQLLLVGGVLLIQCENGDVALVDADPEEHKEFARLEEAVEGQTWNNPCLYGSYLLVRNDEQAACYLLAVGDTSEPAPLAPGLNISWFSVVAGLVLIALVVALLRLERKRIWQPDLAK